MLFTYVAIIHNDKDGQWLEFPDFPGCLAQGDTLDELLCDAKGALECYILGELKDGNDLPSATSIAAFKNHQTTYIQADVDLARDTKYIRKNCTIPEWLNKRAEAKGINFSKVLQEALVALL